MTNMISNTTIRREERRRRQQLITSCIHAFSILLILTIGAITLIKLDYIMKTQADIADTVTQIETETLSVDMLENNASRGDFGPNRGAPIKSLGEFEITHYCSCIQCCGKTDGITATGTRVTEGRTIAVDPQVIALGSTVWIEGMPYVAEDVGGAIKDKHIDIYVADHNSALQLGRKTVEVYQ